MMTKGNDMTKLIDDDLLRLASTAELYDLNEAIREEFRRRQAQAGRSFRMGDTVTFSDKRGAPREGKVVKVNPKTIRVLCGNVTWSVSPTLLKKVG